MININLIQGEVNMYKYCKAILYSSIMILCFVISVAYSFSNSMLLSINATCNIVGGCYYPACDGDRCKDDIDPECFHIGPYYNCSQVGYVEDCMEDSIPAVICTYLSEPKTVCTCPLWFDQKDDDPCDNDQPCTMP